VIDCRCPLQHTGSQLQGRVGKWLRQWLVEGAREFTVEMFPRIGVLGPCAPYKVAAMVTSTLLSLVPHWYVMGNLLTGLLK
jgi:hypothetical protein